MSLTRRKMLAFLASAPSVFLVFGCAARTEDGEAAGATSPPGSGAAAASGDSGAPTAASPGYFRMTRNGDTFRIETNGYPNHPTGTFPNAHCPIAIAARPRTYTITAAPEPAAEARPIAGWLFGVSVNGGVPFDPTGPYLYDGSTKTDWHFEVMSDVARPALGLDQNNAHSQPGGEYHYHGMPVGLLDLLGAKDTVTLVGYAADGYPIYGPWGRDETGAVRELRASYRLKAGAREDAIPGGAHDGTFVNDWEYVEGLGDLDALNGRFGKTPEYPDGTYHYVLTNAFPFVPRAWKGTPDASFAHPSPGPDAVPPELRHYRGT